MFAIVYPEAALWRFKSARPGLNAPDQDDMLDELARDHWPGFHVNSLEPYTYAYGPDRDVQRTCRGGDWYWRGRTPGGELWLQLNAPLGYELKELT